MMDIIQRPSCITGRNLPMSGLGSKADICGAPTYVRFTLHSGHVRCKEGCPLCANSGHARARLKCLTIGNPCVMSLTLRSGGCTNMHREQRAQRTHETASEVFG